MYFDKKIKIFKQICLPERIGILKVKQFILIASFTRFN